MKEDTKSIFQSKTFWSAIVLLLSTALQGAGVVTIEQGEQTAIVTLIVQALAIAGVIFGRYKANKKIK